GAPQTRWQWKVQLVKRLYELGLNRERVRQLFRVLDWILALPPELNQAFREEIHRFEEERKMPYVTSIEQLADEEGRLAGREEGREEGRLESLRESILALLESKFQTAGSRYIRKVHAKRDIKRLQSILQAVGCAQSLAEVRALFR